jgi:hypothetical protein
VLTRHTYIDSRPSACVRWIVAWRRCVILVLVTACSGGSSGDDGGGSGSDGPTIGFYTAASDADETAGSIEIPIHLEPPSEETVFFTVSVAGGTATNGDDYLATIGPMIFPPDATYQPLIVNIASDTIPEDAETAIFSIGNVIGARTGVASHVFTIRNNLLPRVSIEYYLPDWTTDESAAESITLKLSPASDKTVTVDFTLAGTATGADYGIRAGTVTFPPGVSSVDVPLQLIDDALDEDTETLIFELTNPVNAMLDPIMTKITEHIQDDDEQPFVSFASTAQTVPEGNNGTSLVTIDVNLNAPSGRTVTVPFDSAYSTATSGTDFAIQTASPLVFTPGVTTQTISILVSGDTIQDGSEKIQLNFVSPTNASPTNGHVITLANDECYGDPSFVVCPDTIPTSDFAAFGNFSPNMCSMPPRNWALQGQPADVCFLSGKNVTITNDNYFWGTGPVIIYAVDTLTVSGIANLNGRPDYQPSAGANASQCKPFAATPTTSGGGAGGSFITAGGNGGAHSQVAGAPGLAAAPDAAPPSVMRGGCPGQLGEGADTMFSRPGNGGGAIYLIAGNQIILQPGSIVNASGGGGAAWAGPRGGSGGGSGGMIVLWAPSITATGAVVVANGGGGGEGGPANGAGGAGMTCDGTNPLTAPSGGTGSQGGDGGDGFVQGSSAQPGAGANNNNGAGAGGGGAGYIKTNHPLTGASVSPAPS